MAQQVEAGTHQVFLAEVTEATSTPGRPLTYFRRGFGVFAPVDDRRAFVRVREAVLSGEITVRDEVRPEQVAERLGLPVRTVEAALGRLLEDQLVLSDEGGFRVAPLDGPTSDVVLEGRLLLESGVLVRLAGPVRPAQIARLRALAEAIVPLVDGDEFVDPARYATLNHDFHAAVIALAGNSKLGELYDGLAVPSIIARATAPPRIARLPTRCSSATTSTWSTRSRPATPTWSRCATGAPSGSTARRSTTSRRTRRFATAPAAWQCCTTRCMTPRLATR